MLPFLIVGIGVALWGGAVVLALVFWEWVVEAITDWLHDHDLQKSALMDAWIHLERVGTRVRTRIFTKKKHSARAVRIEERTVSMDEIDDEDVRRELERRRQCKRHVMHLLE